MMDRSSTLILIILTAKIVFAMFFHIRAVVFVLFGDIKNLPVHSFNALIIPVLRNCLPNYFLVFLSFLSWFNWWVSFAPDFECCYFCESTCMFLS